MAAPHRSSGAGAACCLVVAACIGTNPAFDEPTESSGSGATGQTTAQASTGVTPSTDPTTGSAATSAGGTCLEGQIICAAAVALTCDGAGGFKNIEACPAACAPDLGCTGCVPGELLCDGDIVVQCDGTGNGRDVVETCDPVQGLACEAGACVGTCAGLVRSSVGCDFYPTMSLQVDGLNTPAQPFAVAVVNVTSQYIDITVTGGAEPVAPITVAGHTAAVIELAWVEELSAGNGSGAPVIDGAYRVRTNGPAAVFQYSSRHPTNSNDASLLLPARAWGTEHVVATYAANDEYPGFYTVTARDDGTTVELQAPPFGVDVQDGVVQPDGSGVVTLDAGDVLQVVAVAGDLTGAIVRSDRPVQVIAGHKCTEVVGGIGDCDHLEEVMPPVEALGFEHVVAPPPRVPLDGVDKPQSVRIVATAGDTTLTFTPDQQVKKTLAAAGDWIDIPKSTERFVVAADKKILVARYDVGSQGGYGDGDPSLAVLAPEHQWRSEYLVHAPTSWDLNFVHLIARSGTKVKVDGAYVEGWSPIGMSPYASAHVALGASGDGVHWLTGGLPFSAVLHGVVGKSSYATLGGMYLTEL